MADRQRGGVLMPTEEEEFVEVDFEEQVEETDLVPYGDEERISEITNELMHQIKQVEADRAEKYRKLSKYRRHRQNEVELEQKNHPYPNSSNLSVPLSLMMGQSTYGILKQTFESKVPFWHVGSQLDNEEMRKDAALLGKYYNMISESRFDLHLRKKNRTIFYEAATLGTCAVKVPWIEKRWLFKRKEQGTTLRDVNSMLQSGPAIMPIAYEDLIYPDYPESMQEKAFIAHRVTLSRSELEDRKAAGVYENIDKVLANPRTEPTERQRIESDIMHKAVNKVEEYDLLEVYFFDDADGDGYNEDIIFTIHEQSGCFMGQQWNNIGWRPFVPVNYMFIPFSTEGRGTCQTVEMMQDEVNAIHNLRVDNMKLANMRMVGVKKQAGMSTREKMYPGKVWFLENPREDINVIQLGEIYPSSTSEENMAVQYAQQAVAMPDIQMGFADQTLKSRDTWRGQQLRASKSGGLFDAIMETIEDAYHEIGMLIFFQLVEHREAVIDKERSIGRLTEEELARLDAILSIPLDEIPRRLIFTINTAEVQESYEAQRQSLMMLNQISTQAQQNLMPIAQMLLGPQGQQLMQQAPAFYQYMNDTFVNNWKTLEKIYEFAGFEDTENYVPNIERQKQLQELLKMMQQQMMAAQGLPQNIGGGNERPVSVGAGEAPQPGGTPTGGGGAGTTATGPQASGGVGPSVGRL